MAQPLGLSARLSLQLLELVLAGLGAQLITPGIYQGQFLAKQLLAGPYSAHLLFQLSWLFMDHCLLQVVMS